MQVSEVVRSLSSIPTLLRKMDTLPEPPTAAEVVNISMDCAAIRSQQVPSEFLELAKLVQEKKCHYAMEIGTYRGGTLFVWSQLAEPGATIISLDYHFTLKGKVFGTFQKPLLKKFGRRGQSIYLLRQDSHKPESLADIKKVLKGNSLDFLFIDGDHTYEGVREDFLMYSPLVRKGGLVAFHDIAESGGSREVYRFWEEIKGKYQYEEFNHKTGRAAMGIGVLHV